MSNAGFSPSLRGAVDLSGLLRSPEATRPSVDGSAASRVFDDQSIGALVELSKSVPVITEIYGGELEPQLESLVLGYGGVFVYGSIRAESSPELVRALQIQGVPVVVAWVGGQPLPLFQGIPPENDVRTVLDQVVELARKNGVTGTIEPSSEEPQEAPLPRLHQEAYDALGRNDIEAAKSAFQKALAENPRDVDAEAGLAQVELLGRVHSVDAQAARATAASSPLDVEAALVVADLDVAGGHIGDAFQRLLGLYPQLTAEDQDILRARLLQLFIVAGSATDEVKKARTALANLMF